MNRLSPAVWPTSCRRNADGAMEIAGVDVRDAVGEHGSPLFLFDEADLRDRARRYRGSYVDAGARLVYYAAKAFLTTTIARWVTDEGLGIDVASGGELAVALRAGVPGERLLMHGNNKSMAEIEAAVAAGVGRIVIDSFEDVVRIADAAARAGIVQPVLVRVTVGVEAHTHEFIATAHEDQKFGLSVASGAADEAVRRIAKLPEPGLQGPALAHRLADLRRRRASRSRRRASSRSPSASGTSRGSRSRSSTSAAAWASLTSSPTIRST